MIKKDESYIRALESELCASIEREEKLLAEEMGVGQFLKAKIKHSKLYKDVISDPNSGMGKIVRAPRSFYRLVKNPEVRESFMQKKSVNKVCSRSWVEPWSVELKDREEVVELALKDGKKIALYFVKNIDYSTSRYRCYNTFEATLESEKWQAVYFLKDEVEEALKNLPRCNVLIFGREAGLSKSMKKLIEAANKEGIKVGLDIDDLVFDKKYLDLFLETTSDKSNRSYWVGYFAGVKEIADKMDFFSATNEFLAEKLTESFGKPVKIIRNSLNREQIEASEVYVRNKIRKDEKFVIGYFSGSNTHRNDLKVALPQVLKFLKKHDDAILRIVGFMTLDKDAQKMEEQGKIQFSPFTDFRKLQRLMAEVDVNIAPLVINDFTNCKSELKFFEAAMVETTTIASPSYTFSRAIEDGKNGFLAQPGEWYEKLEYLYKHPEKNHEIAMKAREYALKHYYGKEFLKEVEAAYEYFAK